MRPPVIVAALAVALLLSCFAASAATGADRPRTAPTRPGESGRQVSAKARTPAPRKGGDTVPVLEAAAALGLKFDWKVAGREAVLTNHLHRLEIETGSREIAADGLRVFLGEPTSVEAGRLSFSRIDYESCLVPLFKPAAIKGWVPRPKVIVLDPGHGGADNGTQNEKLGLKEKTFTLDVALRLKRLLEIRGYKVVLTRDSDERVDLVERSLIANRAGADLFLSIHFNSLPNDTRTSGAEVFTFPPQHQRSTNSWGVAHDDTEDDAAPVNRYDAWSMVLANALHRQVIEDLKVFDRGKKLMHLGVLRGLKCPGALVESGFLSNPDEARKIATPGYRQRIAAALASGIVDYARVLDSTGH